MKLPRYFIVGSRPVKFMPTPSGGMAVVKMNWDTGAFEYGMEYLTQVYSSDPDVEEVSENEFIDRVEALRSRIVPGEGTIQALYKVINATEDLAKQQGRELTEDEKALVSELRRQTYELFEAAHPYVFRPEPTDD